MQNQNKNRITKEDARLYERIARVIAGLFLILVSLVPVWIDKDATATVFFVPLGLYLIFGRHKNF